MAKIPSSTSRATIWAASPPSSPYPIPGWQSRVQGCFRAALTETAAASFTVRPTISLEPESPDIGQEVTVTGHGFAANSTYRSNSMTSPYPTHRLPMTSAASPIPSRCRKRSSIQTHHHRHRQAATPPDPACHWKASHHQRQTLPRPSGEAAGSALSLSPSTGLRSPTPAASTTPWR